MYIYELDREGNFPIFFLKKKHEAEGLERETGTEKKVFLDTLGAGVLRKKGLWEEKSIRVVMGLHSLEKQNLDSYFLIMQTSRALGFSDMKNNSAF